MNIIIRKIIKFLITTVLLSAIQNLLKSELNKRVVPKAENFITSLFRKIFRKKKSYKVKPLSKSEKEDLKKKNEDVIDME